MTIADSKPAAVAIPTVTLTIDGISVTVPKGTLIIRAAETIGVQIPRFCDHPLLDPIGACRQCLVEVEMGGRAMPKPQASCTTEVADGMVVKTQLTSDRAEKAQRGVMEMLLINHPLDCPICDKGGECPLQNQAMSSGQSESRFTDVKRTFPKPINISSQVLLDRERCILCARCTRFSKQIGGDPFIELFERSALEQVAIYEDEPFESYFSGNTVQICPVGALTGAAYRFRSRPFDLQSTPSVCEHCASGCAQRTDWRRGKVMRRLAEEDPEVNEEWNCDKGRWAFTYATATDRFMTPRVRDEAGNLVEASWPEALERAAEGLRTAMEAGGVGVLPGGRLTAEDAYAYAKFARVVLGTNDIDSRARAHSDEELEFLAVHVAGIGPKNGGVTYDELEHASSVLLVGFEPEEESPIVFLRLRKAFLKHGQRSFAIAPFETPGTRKIGASIIQTSPGSEAVVLSALSDGSAGGTAASAVEAIKGESAVVLVGERLAEIPGALRAVSAFVRASGARVAWIPRRAGERGAIDAGALPSMLPGGRLVAETVAREQLARAWGGEIPAEVGRDLTGILSATKSGELGGLLFGGVDPYDLPDPQLALDAMDQAKYVVSLEMRPSAVTERADVILPIAPSVEKSGSYTNWEGRRRGFDLTLHKVGAMTDGRVLHALADELDVDLRLPAVESARMELDVLGATNNRATAGDASLPSIARPEKGSAILASWHLLLDAGSMQDGEEYLAGTARASLVRLSAATASEIGAEEGDTVTVSTDAGSIRLPLAVTPMPDRVVWVPMNSTDSAVRRDLGVPVGSVVAISAGRPA